MPDKGSSSPLQRGSPTAMSDKQLKEDFPALAPLMSLDEEPSHPLPNSFK